MPLRKYTRKRKCGGTSPVRTPTPTARRGRTPTPYPKGNRTSTPRIDFEKKGDLIIEALKEYTELFEQSKHNNLPNLLIVGGIIRGLKYELEGLEILYTKRHNEDF